jgi:hypothetical protein
MGLERRPTLETSWHYGEIGLTVLPSKIGRFGQENLSDARDNFEGNRKIF